MLKSIVSGGHRLAVEEDGSAGVWSLFVFLICVVVAGLAIDGTNGLRAREQLQTTADIAAHAGVVELYNGGSDQEVRERVAEIVEANMPVGLFGNSLGTSSATITIGTYENGVVSQGLTSMNDAVYVSLGRTSRLGNAVPTFLLDFVGMDSWNIIANSAAHFGEIDSCAGNDGIYVQGEIKITSHLEIGSGFCIYSKDAVELSNHNEFITGSGIGMPDTDDCSKCTYDHNPGVEDALFEGNLLLTDVSTHINTVMNSLLGLSDDYEPADDFVDSVVLDTDMSPLTDLGYQANKIGKGSIISIAAGDFESLDRVPSGLVYAVYCDSELDADGALSPTGASSDCNGNSKKKDCSTSTGNVKTLSMETGSGTAMSDIAVITDCQIKFGTEAHITNSVVITTSTSNQSISAFAKARIGSNLLTCPSTEKVIVMTQGDFSVPAGVETNNVDFYIAGDAHLASGTSSQASKLGTSFHVGGEMHISAQGTWEACGDELDSLNSDIEVIRYVIASQE
ncbi:TadE/TadG family type IV pilus assembly protein [Aliiruegeria lutimaris]|uniref:Flp pilus assembly protein TadG n=1 Tax=Aliiruegeria lutimaris TaxID=571298 RepID=A0A1G8K425_9RHOB|nr:Tad domain-containing protein [Aliiruegeria lutimaris]SDI38184.1 Flp pilus assembly protein TadG [Aliiruegeria lutimaris]